MRVAAVLCLALLLAGCGQGATDTPPDAPAEVEFEQHWPGHVAVSDDYRIQATFPEDQPVCVSDVLTHIHGFHQFFAGDCADQSTASDRFISVWGDYNAAFYDWDQAAALSCGEETEPFDLGMVASGEGRLSACIPKLCGDQYVITAVYLSDSPAMDLGEEAVGGGPDLIYTIALGTTAETQEADLAEFRAFLADLRLDGGSFGPAES